MPNTLFDSKSQFDREKALLWRWLKTHAIVVQSLSDRNLTEYKNRKFIAGWLVKLKYREISYTFDVLIDHKFPYSPIRIAYRLEDVYLKWPHVEEQGVLCLPRIPAPVVNVEAIIKTNLEAAIELVINCKDKNFLHQEFQNEFLSYWERSVHSNLKSIRSLINVQNPTTRRIAVWEGRHYTVVGDTADQVKQWLENSLGKRDEINIKSGIFAVLSQPPIPPFPDRPNELITWLGSYSAYGLEELGKLPINQDNIIILGANTSTGIGLIAFNLNAPKTNGYRKGHIHSSTSKIILWQTQGQLKRAKVSRIDAPWVHGRGLNKQQPVLHSAKVLILGCGSLGSHVAVRLAQSGVGHIVMVDPDHLEAANVGRHVLGINSLKQLKALALAEQLKTRFPHLNYIKGCSENWQVVFESKPEYFANADLIISCLGDWSADGPLGELQVREEFTCPIVYGWLDEQGTAAHALALIGKQPALNCILDNNGQLRVPETLWEGSGLSQAEPACGTVFQPYGAIDVAYAEALVTRLCLELLVGTANSPIHRIYAASSDYIEQAGGAWSEEHLKNRPRDFRGAFEYERYIEPCNNCSACSVKTHG